MGSQCGWGRRFRLPGFWLVWPGALGQQAQNPSPMVEHTRAHPRLPQQSPAGRREKLDLGTLFLPAGLKAAPRKASDGAPILFFFHGGTWLPEVGAAGNRVGWGGGQAGEGRGPDGPVFSAPARSLG